MTTYHFTAPQFEGHIIIAYRDGILTRIDMEPATFPEGEANIYALHMFLNVPLYEENLDAFEREKPERKITKIPDRAPEFEAFWTAYSKGRSEYAGNRQDAKKAWTKLSITEKIAAIAHIPKYLRQKADTNYNLAYGATYLNKKSWE